MDDYDFVKKSSLRFKGEKKKKKSKVGSVTNEQTRNEVEEMSKQDERSEDANDHGGWWKVEKYEHIRDDVAIEFLPGCYARASSSGDIILGNPHPPGEGPDEEEIFTAIFASTNQIALKSGFGRYLSVQSNYLRGLSEAIGEREAFLPVFEDGKLALCTYNDRFLSPSSQSNSAFSLSIVAEADKVGPSEILNIRVNNNPVMFTNKEGKDKGTLYEAELGYIQKQQGHKEKHYLLGEDKKLLKKARAEGQLHEVLLDKRTKVKSDKYCK